MTIGSAFKKAPPDYGPLAETVAAMRDSITEEVSRGIVATVTAAITEALAGGITVEAPHVSVSAPDVTVTPTITVDVPGEDDAGEIAAIDRQTAILQVISSKLDRLLLLSTQPVTRRVIRDANNQIIEVTEVRS